MGVFTKSKSAAGLNEAQAAFDNGDTIWLGRYWDEVFAVQGTGAIGGAADFIMAVEAVGWHLQQVTYSWVPEKKRGLTVMLFRRP
jgi:hypothetical protein